MFFGRALVYRDYGNPNDVLHLEDRTIFDIASNQVLVKRLASVIHASDFGKIRGTYGRLSAIPAIAGGEGVGQICEVGSNVKKLKCGMHVRIPGAVGAWQDYCILEEDIPVMAKHADKECNPLYPVPKLMNTKELEK